MQAGDGPRRYIPGKELGVGPMTAFTAFGRPGSGGVQVNIFLFLGRAGMGWYIGIHTKLWRDELIGSVDVRVRKPLSFGKTLTRAKQQLKTAADPEFSGRRVNKFEIHRVLQRD